MLKILKKMIKKRRGVIIFSLVFFFVLLSPYLLSAQERELEVEYPEIFGLEPETIRTGLPEYVRYIFNFSIVIVGFVLFGSLIWGGILYLTSTGNIVKLKEARDQISSAFLGTILLLSGYIILTTINPNLTIFRFPILKKPEVPAYKPPEYKPEEMTQIFWEIPIGQMLEEGLWGKEQTDKLKVSSVNFEQFLERALETGGPTFNRISDLNKYLKSLTKSCRCEELDGICQEPENFSFPVGCIGDPCEKVRDKINNVLKINEKKSKELSAYKEKLIEVKNIFVDEGRKFRKLTEEILVKCKQRGLLTRAEYYANVAFFEEQGGTTKLERLYLPAKDDPLVFYCAVGGTVFDHPHVVPEQIFLGELEEIEELVLKPVEREPLSCPVEIPLGELIMDQISAISYGTNSNLVELIYYIDKILVELTNMTELISQCNESRCNISCSCVPNPCYEPACGIPPLRVNRCGIGRCAIPTPVTPNFCYFFCDSPCLQAVGGCHGDPCPRQKIIETVKLIKIYEDEIFRLLDGIKGGIESAQLILNAEEEGKIDLDMIREVTQACLSLGAWEKPEEEPFWVLLRCEMAIGNIGPGGNTITNCHPQNLFCCSTKPLEVSPFPAVLSIERPPVYTALPEGPYSPSEYGFNQVPYFSQYDEKWRNKPFGCRTTTIGQAGCGPTSIAMALSFFGEKTDPPTIADWVLKSGYRVCGAGTAHAACCKAVETFGKEEGIRCKELHGNIKAVLDELRSGKNKVAVVSGRGDPPYTKGGHYIVLTGIKEKWDQEFIYYNDSAHDPLRPQIRPSQGRKPIDWFERQGIGAGCVIYK